MEGDAAERGNGKASVSGAEASNVVQTGPAEGKRRISIQGRGKLFDIPCGVYEIPGRPHVIFKIQDYKSAERPRREIPFLFQAFEAGQEPPPEMKGLYSKKHRNRSRDSLLDASTSKRQKVAAPSGSVSTTHHHQGGGGTVAEDSQGPLGNGNSNQENGGLSVPPVTPVVPSSGASNERPATIHEYLDWTVTANCTRPESEQDSELDFEGFRVVTVCGRHRPAWPRPGDHLVKKGNWAKENEQIKLPWMGETLPPLSVSGSAYSAATLRSGYGSKPGEKGKHWIEVPFFATASTKRGRGYGRCLLDAIEHICQVLDVSALHLCSTNDPTTTCIWRKLGFTDNETDVNENLAACGLTLKGPGLLHMDNTVQMFKSVPKHTGKDFRRIRISHQSLVQVLYFKPLSSSSSQAGDERAEGCEGKERVKSVEDTS